MWFPAAIIEGHGNDLSSSQGSLPNSCYLGCCVLTGHCHYVVPQHDWKIASFLSQISFHSTWICRINTTVIVGKKMENYRVQKWVLEGTSRIIVLAWVREGGGEGCPSSLMWRFSPVWTDLGRKHRIVEIQSPGFNTFVLHSFFICLFNYHFLSACHVALSGLWI